MRLGFKIAVRFLTSNRAQTFLIILGIGIGVSVQIFIGSLIQGLQKGLVEKTIGNSSQITVSSNLVQKEISNYQDIVDMVVKGDGKIKAVSVASDHPGFLAYGKSTQSVLVRGFDMKNADKIYDFTGQLTQGRTPNGSNEIIVGEDLKALYGVGIGSKVNITTTKLKKVECVIVGFFDLKVATINKNWVVTTLATAQALFDTGDRITSIESQVNDDSIFEADVIGKKLTTTIQNDSLTVDNWKDQNQQLLSGLQGQSISSYMIQVFVLISVVLGIASVLAITVMQKSRQIGILKAMGLKNSTSSSVFLFEGLLLGTLGAIAGILFGIGLSYSFTKFALNPDGTPVIALYIDYGFMVISGAIAIVSSVLAALIPAIRSSRLNPIDIIRNN